MPFPKVIQSLLSSKANAAEFPPKDYFKLLAPHLIDESAGNLKLKRPMEFVKALKRMLLPSKLLARVDPHQSPDPKNKAPQSLKAEANPRYPPRLKELVLAPHLINNKV